MVQSNTQILVHYYSRHNQLLNTSDGAHSSAYLIANSVVVRSVNGDTTVLLHNRHDSVIGELGTNTQFYQYSVYGVQKTEDGVQRTEDRRQKTDSGTLDLAINPLQYSGYIFDSLTGLYYLKARDYDPYLRSFMQVDSYAFNNQGLINGYYYGNNNPVMGVDPGGHVFELAPDVITSEISLDMLEKAIHNKNFTKGINIDHSSPRPIEKSEVPVLFNVVKESTGLSACCSHAAMLYFFSDLGIPLNNADIASILIGNKQIENSYYILTGKQIIDLIPILAKKASHANGIEDLRVVVREQTGELKVRDYKKDQYDNPSIYSTTNKLYMLHSSEDYGTINSTENHAYYLSKDLTEMSAWDEEGAFLFSKANYSYSENFKKIINDELLCKISASCFGHSLPDFKSTEV